MNIGPRIRYFADDNKQALPFTMNAGFGYKRSFCNQNNINFLSIAGELRCEKELVSYEPNVGADPFYVALVKSWQNYSFKEELQIIGWHKGIELGILNTVFLRRGSHLDINGSRNELTFGAGVNLFNHFRFDISTIFGPEGLFQGPTSSGASGVRHHQKKVGFTYSGFGKWKSSDRTWWKISD